MKTNIYGPGGEMQSQPKKMVNLDVANEGGDMQSQPKKMVNLAGTDFDRYMRYMYEKEWLNRNSAGMYSNMLYNMRPLNRYKPVDASRVQVMGNAILMDDGYNYLPVRYTLEDGTIAEGLVNMNGIDKQLGFSTAKGFVPDKGRTRGKEPYGLKFNTTEPMDSYDWNPAAAINFNIPKYDPRFYDSQMIPGQYFKGADGIYYKNKNPNLEMVTNEELSNKQFYVDKDNGMTVEDKGFARGGSMPTKQKKPTKPSPEWIKNQYGLMAHIAPGYSNDEWDVYI